MLLSAIAAKLQRMIYSLDAYVNASDEEIGIFDSGSLHTALIALYHQSTEAHQMVLGTLEKIAQDRRSA